MLTNNDYDLAYQMSRERLSAYMTARTKRASMASMLRRAASLIRMERAALSDGFRRWRTEQAAEYVPVFGIQAWQA